MNLKTLPLPVKVLFTSVLITLGVGYLFAILYLYLLDVEPHTRHGMGLVSTVIVKYYGQRNATRLEAALNGRMGDYVTVPEKKQIIRWIRSGATEAGFIYVQPILKKACGGCHNNEYRMLVPPLTTYDEISPLIAVDLGQSIKSLVRVSHVHLFGMGFMFTVTGLIFAFSEMRPPWRALWIAIPFLAIWLDIGSWWFTKSDPLFAYTVIAGGALMGVSLALQIGISLAEMWFFRRNGGGKR